MKQLKLDQYGLSKQSNFDNNNNIPNNLIINKTTNEATNKQFDNYHNKIEDKQSENAKNDFYPSELALMESKNTEERKGSSLEGQKLGKELIKLPNINMKGKKVSMEAKFSMDGEDNGDFVKENKYVNQGISNQSKGKAIRKAALTEDNNAEDKISSFLKFIQIRPMKPSEKSPPQKNDIQSIRHVQRQKSIQFELNKTNVRECSPSEIEIESSESNARTKKPEKSEKSLTTYSIRKEKKKVLSISQSISQSTQPMRQKKLITNSYYDFCNYICILNKVKRPTTPIATYKAFVGKGNNSILIKNSLKSRFWWNIGENDSEANLFWSQNKEQKFVESLKCTESKEKNNNYASKKSIEFIIPKSEKELTDKAESIREFTSSGLNRFLSEEERKQYSKSQHQVELSNLNDLEELGNPNKNKIHNHLEFHWHISNKKALYYNLKKYYSAMTQDPFEYIPLTFHIQQHGDNEWERFVICYNEKVEDLKKRKDMEFQGNKRKKEKNLWIVKPGENSNQGNGIQVFDNINEIVELVKNATERTNGKQRSYIIQRYLMPFLYNKRKFDIRCYVLVTCVKGIYKAYWYEEGYIRTSSKEFTLKNLKNRFIHLTNDAVQKKSEDYGKYENGNKVSFSDFQKYLDNNFPDKDYNFFKTVYPSMIKRASDAIKSTCMLMDAKKREFCFEIFGLDFMIDEDFATWLIEVNTNPCLELGSPLLARIIPNMIENALRIAVDPIFPPPKDIPKTKTLAMDIFETNKFTLIFNSSEDEEILSNLTKDTNLENIVESDEEDENHDDVE